MSEVIDLKTRKPFALARSEERKQRRAANRKKKRDASEAAAEHRDAMIEILEGLLTMAREGHLEGLVLLSRDTKHKIFLTEILLDDRVIPPNDLHAFVGVMETLKLELADQAAATAPALLIGGQLIDPTAIPEHDWVYE